MDNSFYINHLNLYKSHVLVDLNMRFMVYTIYKNMSSKLRAELKKVYKINKTIKYKRDKVKMQSLQNANKRIIKMLNKNNLKDIYKVGFVRNPIERYISLFFYFKGIKNRKYLNINKDTNINDWTKEYFIKNLNKISYKSNYHFNTQTSFLYYEGKLVVDEAIKIENVDYEYLRKKGIKLNRNVVNKSRKEEVILDDTTLKIIKDVYRDDFENFIS